MYEHICFEKIVIQTLYIWTLSRIHNKQRFILISKCMSVSFLYVILQVHIITDEFNLNVRRFVHRKTCDLENHSTESYVCSLFIRIGVSDSVFMNVWTIYERILIHYTSLFHKFSFRFTCTDFYSYFCRLIVLRSLYCEISYRNRETRSLFLQVFVASATYRWASKSDNWWF